VKVVEQRLIDEKIEVERSFGFAVPAIIVGSPVIEIVAVLVRIKLGSPVIFSQVRPGRNEKPFTIYKFRSMLDEYTADGRQLTQTERLVGEVTASIPRKLDAI